MGATETIQARVTSITREAEGISLYELRNRSGHDLPPFTAGAHVDLHLPNGMIRSYSLVNPEHERHRYVIAVNKDAASRGGSRFIHEHLRDGDAIAVGAPRNNFALDEDAAHSVLIAGGIGITPLWCMIQRLEALDRSWELYFSTRTRQHAAFLGPLRRLGARVHWNFDREPGGAMLDLAQIVHAAPPGAHLYCCGPLPMLDAFERATASRPSQSVHVEYFAARAPAATRGGFTVVLARSGRSLTVLAGKTILETLLDGGLDVQHSCTQGVCGSCETAVLEGVPDHRDLVLSKEEHARNRTMMICCSGSKSPRLVLDL
jgi:vanillate O-demethylase ferredoxin subunit